VVQNVAGHVRETEIAATVPVSQFSMIDAEQVQDRGMDIMHMDRFVDSLEAKVVRGSINGAALDRTASQPHSEPEWILVAASLQVARSSSDFAHRGAAKFGSAYDQRVFP